MRALQFANIVPAGAPFGGVDINAQSVPQARGGIQPPVSPNRGQGWWCVVHNATPLWLEVNGGTGAKWVPPFVADVFGSHCDPIVPLIVAWVDFAGGTGPCTIGFSWTIEPESYGPQAAAYPSGNGV